MKNYNKPQMPEEVKWVPTSFGCPQRHVKKVRILLTNGKIGYGTYINRERRWIGEDGKILNNVSAWRLVPDSFQSLDTETQDNEGTTNNVSYKENCNYPHIEDTRG